MIRHLCIFLIASTAAGLVAGCEITVRVPDSGPPQASKRDGGGTVEDAGSGDPDAGYALDAGAEDAGDPDAGVSEDAGTADAGPPPFRENGVWLTRNYVAYSAFYDPLVVNDLALRMSTQYQVSDWFVNADRTGSDGRLINPPPHFNDFLNNVAAWEGAHGTRFRVFAWVSGATTGTTAMDLTDPAVRQAVVNECQKLVSPTVAGSFVAATQRPFDGVQIDFEPSGTDQIRFNALILLMQELRAGLDQVGRPDALLSFAAHKMGTSNSYQWSPDFYYAMAQHVDVLASMTYNSGTTTDVAYETWMRDELTGVLRAVSGRGWSDGNHPAPTRPVTVLFGLPSYPASASHDPTVENVQYGARGLHQGIEALESVGDPSLDYLGGAAVYLHTKGTADDSYARWDTEWWWFGHDWLQRW